MNDPFLINDNYSFSPSISVKILVTALATGILILTIHSSEITSFPSGVLLGRFFKDNSTVRFRYRYLCEICIKIRNLIFFCIKLFEFYIINFHHSSSLSVPQIIHSIDVSSQKVILLVEGLIG